MGDGFARQRLRDAHESPGEARTRSAAPLATATAGPQHDLGRIRLDDGGDDVYVELKHDIERIKDELDSAVFTESVEEEVLAILRKWAQRGALASGYLDWVFDGLQVTREGFLSDTTYYDAMLDSFDRADEVRRLRDSTRRHRGLESVKETARREEEAAERRDVDVAADLAGGWVENVAESYSLPRTPENVTLAKLAVLRLSMIPSDELTLEQRAISAAVSRQGHEALLRMVHFSTESERAEGRRQRLRAALSPLFEIVLWITAERLAAFAFEAVLARLFPIAAETGGAIALAGGGEAALGAIGRREAGSAAGTLARSGATRGEARATTLEGSVVVREGYTYRIEAVNARTGEVTAIGKDLRTGEVVRLQVNVDTGAGVAARSGGEMLPIRGGKLDAQTPALRAGEGTTAAEAQGAKALTPLQPGTTAEASGLAPKAGAAADGIKGGATATPTRVASWDELREAANRATPRKVTGTFRSQPVRVGDRSAVVVEGRVAPQISQKESLARYTETLPGEHATHVVGLQLGENLPEGIASGPAASLNLGPLKQVENATRSVFERALEHGATVETKTLLFIEHRMVGGSEVPVLVRVEREAWLRAPGSDEPFRFMNFAARIDPTTRQVTILRNQLLRPTR